MSEAIVINADAFFDRLTHLYNSWKSDKRSSDGVFGGTDSIVVLAGKAEQESSYQKHNALHVRLRVVISPTCEPFCGSSYKDTNNSRSSGCSATSFLQH